MNAKVQEFIDKMIEKLKAEELKQKEDKLKQREEHLISLGLYEFKNDREYNDYKTIIFTQWDEEKKKYYIEIEKKVALKITDEEYQEILKYAPIIEEKKEVKKEFQTTWANAINITATIFLVLNIIGAFILAIEFGWIPIIIALTYCVLWYPIIIGFSKIVAVAEKNL